ncbi:hypothetical protein AVEN_221651-1 [Araneus ventricosus]|uniref:Uncharacterized protein n=1 Tax=Araneus ventricosus TaxID=182803 RepID=A0A4Y2SYB2_ARAVE|nr:hypothetical protein AVEN_221651-1 [Araneus ventricosus]
MKPAAFKKHFIRSLKTLSIQTVCEPIASNGRGANPHQAFIYRFSADIGVVEIVGSDLELALVCRFVVADSSVVGWQSERRTGLKCVPI